MLSPPSMSDYRLSASTTETVRRFGVLEGEDQRVKTPGQIGHYLGAAKSSTNPEMSENTSSEPNPYKHIIVCVHVYRARESRDGEFIQCTGYVYSRQRPYPINGFRVRVVTRS